MLFNTVFKNYNVASAIDIILVRIVQDTEMNQKNSKIHQTPEDDIYCSTYFYSNIRL